jgi:hypothetical protein
MSKLISTLQMPDGVCRCDPDDTLHIYDVFDSNKLNQILAYSKPKYIVSDHWTKIDINSTPIYAIPLWLAANAKSFKSAKLLPPITQHTFNFMINKKQVNRHLCLKLVELFKLTDYAYTWSGISPEFDMSDIILELDTLGENSPLTPKERAFMLASVSIKPNFIAYQHNHRDNSSVLLVDQNGHGDNSSDTEFVVGRRPWNDGLNTMFSSSAVSLITESAQFQKGAVFTEKTLYSILGLSLPIWVGGYQQATEWNRLGFDIFDDIIDHSYQNYDTVFERCYHALADNLDLLTNKQRTAELRQQLLPRLETNRNLILDQHLIRFIKQEVSLWPLDLQQHIPAIFKIYSL